MKRQTWRCMASPSALALLLALLQGCGVTHIGRNKSFGPHGLISDNQSCNAACAERVDVPGGGEKCVRFSKGMAEICLDYKDKVQPKGTFVFEDPP